MLVETLLFWAIIIGSLLAFVSVLRNQFKAPPERRSNALTNLSLLGAVFVSLFLLSEVGFRIRHLIVRDVPFFSSLSNYQHQDFGWAGKQSFGSKETTKKKLFFLGDSFTHGMGVPEEKMYYRVLEQRAEVEPFIYAGPGYGTLQELLALKHYLPEVKPDLVVLQVCSNDLINNDWELDSKSYHNNTPLERPYWEAGKIAYRFPRNFPALRLVLPRHSRVFHFIFTKIELLQLIAAKKGYLHSVEIDIQRQGTAHPAFARSVAVTEELVMQIKNAAGEAPVVVFSSDEVEPYHTELREMFARVGIAFIPHVPNQVAAAEEAGQKLRMKDGVHWNVNGHRVVGESLLQGLREQKLLD